MSLVTVSEKKGGRVYQREFDHDEARRLRAEGWSLAKLADHFDVSYTGVRRVVDPKAAAKAAAHTNEYLRRKKRKPCKGGCGTLVWALDVRRSGYCQRCLAARGQSDSVRETTLRCSRCNEWKPDEEFYRRRRAIARRGRGTMCRSCGAIARRDHRRRNAERERVHHREWRRKRTEELRQMAKYVVLRSSVEGFVEVGRVDSSTQIGAIEKLATEPGEYVAVSESRFVVMQVEPVRKLAVVVQNAGGGKKTES